MSFLEMLEVAGTVYIYALITIFVGFAAFITVAFACYAFINLFEFLYDTKRKLFKSDDY